MLYAGYLSLKVDAILLTRTVHCGDSCNLAVLPGDKF